MIQCTFVRRYTILIITLLTECPVLKNEGANNNDGVETRANPHHAMRALH